MYEFFQNSSPATTAVLPRRMGSADIVLLTRSNQPGEGLLALPGGFLQYHERPIDAVRREVREEIDIDVEVDRLLETYLVDYRFRGAIVSVMELVFLCKAIDMNVGAIRSSEATAVGYYDLREVLQSPSQLAFPEQEQALRQYLCHAGL